MLYLFPISIFVITAVFYFLRKHTPFKVCAVCAGVSSTWILGLAAKYYGLSVDQGALAVLMGGSVVGIMYQIDKKNYERFTVWAKSIYLISGFFAAYNLLNFSWGMALIGALAAFLVYAFLIPKPIEGYNQKEIEKRMIDHCCD